MIFQIRQTIDIKKDNPVLEYKQGLDYGNNLAHEWLVFVEEDGALVDLASVAVTGYFLREDGVTVKVDGSVKNGACSVVFDRRCYVIEGAVKCAMVLTRGVEVVTSAKLRTNANQNITDKIIDTGDTIPTDIYDLLTQIDAMREATAATVAATAAANTAAERANAGAERAEQLQIDANGFAGDSNKLGGKAPEYYLSTENLLDNSDWRIKKNIVNQRGQDSYSGNTYTIDRWRMWDDTSTITVNDGSINVAGYLYQHLFMETEKIYTFAAKKKDGTVLLVSGKPSAAPKANGLQINVRDAAKNVCYVVLQAVGEVVWTALYEGTYTAETLPPYVQPDPAVDLMKCEYRYQKYRFATWAAIGSGFSSNTATAHLFFTPEAPLADDVNISLTMTGNILYRVNGKTYNIDASTGTVINHTNMLLIQFPGLSIDSSDLNSAGFFLNGGTSALTVEISTDL